MKAEKNWRGLGGPICYAYSGLSVSFKIKLKIELPQVAMHS